MKKYYAMLHGTSAGPYTLAELHAAGVGPDTYVWCKGMSDWAKAEDVAEICRFYRQYLAGETPQGMEPRHQESIAEGKPEPLEAFPEVPFTDTDTNRHPRNLLPYAIAATLLCFPITGIAAVIYSIRTNKLWKCGQKDEAYEAYRKARMLTGITFFLGFLAYPLLMHLLR